MTPAEDYRALRAAGWRALDAYRATRPDPTEWTERAADALDKAGQDRTAVTWSHGPYTMTARLVTDEYADNDEYGEWTDDAGPDTIRDSYQNGRTDRDSRKHFRPEYSPTEHATDARARGMAAGPIADAWRQHADAQLRRARDAWYVFADVRASIAGVELGRASLAELDIDPDPALPYGIARSLTVRYVAETLADLATQAIDEATEERPRIAAALAETAAQVAP